MDLYSSNSPFWRMILISLTVVVCTWPLGYIFGHMQDALDEYKYLLYGINFTVQFLSAVYVSYQMYFMDDDQITKWIFHVATCFVLDTIVFDTLLMFVMAAGGVEPDPNSRNRD